MRELASKAVTQYRSRGLIRVIGLGWLFVGKTIDARCKTLAAFWNHLLEREYSLGTIFIAYYRGFDPKTYCWLDISHNDPDDYAADPAEYADVNTGYRDVIGNDYSFHRFSSRYTDAIPELFGTIEGGTFRPSDRAERSLPELLRTTGSLVLKPMKGSQGSGFYHLEYDGSRVLVNGEERDEKTVESIVDDCTAYTVTEYVRQHDYAAQIYDRTPNTIRVLTIVDPDTGDPVLLRACHRFGSSESHPTDNWSRSGYAAPLDVDTGTIKEIVLLDESGRRSSRETHPETGSQVAGITVPFWNETTAVVLRLADIHRPAPIIGWDVIISEDGPKVVEANTPGQHLIQFERGVYEDERFRSLVDNHPA